MYIFFQIIFHYMLSKDIDSISPLYGKSSLRSYNISFNLIIWISFSVIYVNYNVYSV